MVKGTTKSLGNKHSLDKFYTKEGVVEECLKHLKLEEYDVVIEPSAGSGSFSNRIPHDKVYAYDIQPENEGIIQGDYLKISKEQYPFNERKVLVVGNPPFGNNGSLALKFIKESVYADTIAFILPRGFKKESVKNRIPLNYHLQKEVDMVENSFTLNGEDYNVPCVFQVWVRRDTKRVKEVSTIINEYIRFVKKEDADFRVQRVGGRSGKSDKNLDVSEQSNYFIKNISNLEDDRIIDVLNKLNYPSKDFTTGPRSIPKGELVECLVKYIKENELK